MELFGELSKHYYWQPIANATTMKVIGAYGKGAAAQPPRDIDMLFVMPAEGTACSTDEPSFFTGVARPIDLLNDRP